MCGIAGFFEPSGFGYAEAEAIAIKMRDRLIHRGPDDAGVWLDGSVGIAMAHRRLSILDLSPAGHQPMISTSGCFVLVFNGEIYNHQTIRRMVEDTRNGEWRGHSDTETLLEAIELWGVEQTLNKSVGMFALALWDRQERCLTLARDRMGEKPLYYGWQRGTLLFGSELKALRTHPAFASEIERDVLPLYLRHGYIPAPWSVWRGIRKLLPGCTVSFTVQNTNVFPEPKPYWSFADTVQQGISTPFTGGDIEAIDALESVLGDAVTRQMVADVPLGAFLSGGIDSSTVVALMQAQSSRPVRTFSIGFDETSYNEAPHAKAMASHLGTDHTELYIQSAHAQAVIPRLPQYYDEPFGDSSAIPTFLVAELAQQHVTVALSGDGGDELFGGYGRYFNSKARRLWQLSQRFPKPVSRWLPMLMGRSVSPFGAIGAKVAQRMEMIADLSGCDDHPAYYERMTSQWYHLPTAFQPSGLPYGLNANLVKSIQPSLLQMMAIDSVTYFPDDILVKVDRAAMAVSLETRVPLLDHRVVELAWQLPTNLKAKDGVGKWILRQVLYRYAPKELIERPKMGFGVPVDAWIRGPLRDWAETLLNEKSLVAGGFLDPGPIRHRWKQHLDGHLNWRDSLWLVLMWQAWQQETNLHNDS